MTHMLDIAEVARRTGLTSRALRFYEARGLVRPLRTASGRRVFGAGELERLHSLVALKRAGLSLAQIKTLFDRRPIDMQRLIAAQIEAIGAQEDTLRTARAILQSTLSRIDRGEPLDAETFCSLIRTGDTMMETENWKTIADRFFTPEEQAQWAQRLAQMPAGFDPEAYSRAWAELGTRIAAALPLDPTSAAAQALLDEWQALLAPFTAAATPEMMAGATGLYDRMGEWQGEHKPPFPMEVWRFIQAAGKARAG